MSMPFDPDDFAGPRARLRRSSGRAGRASEPIRTGKPAFNGRELRMMIGIGLALGVAMFQGTRHAIDLRIFESEPPPRVKASTATAADPYAEARRSRAILGAQTGERTALDAAALLSGITVRPNGFRLGVDGTLQVRGDRIRLADVQLPSLGGGCPYEIDLAGRAIERLGQLLAAGPFQLGESGGPDADAQGRKLRIATRRGHSIGGMLVRDGLAHDAQAPGPWCASGMGFV